MRIVWATTIVLGCALMGCGGDSGGGTGNGNDGAGMLGGQGQVNVLPGGNGATNTGQQTGGVSDTSGQAGATDTGGLGSAGAAGAGGGAASQAGAPAGGDGTASDPNAADSTGGMNDAAGDDAAQMDPMAGEHELALDECDDLNSGWDGDQYCILPPPPDKGFQVHVGPSDYDNPGPQYLLQPGQETNQYFSATSGNDKDVYFYYRQYRLRPGTHHMIISAGGGASSGIEIGGGRRLGGSQNLAKDNPDFGVIAPENEDVGVPLSARSPLTVNLHYINVTDKPVIQEVWINFWYKDASEVKEEAKELFQIGSASFAVPPGADQVLGPYSCDVNGSGRILTLYGHRHANTVRFSAWRVRNGQRELIYEDYDWHDPKVLEFNSVVENPMPDPTGMLGGGATGILDLMPGDKLEWECHVINQTDGTLRFTNQTYDGEMCILIGDTVGTGCSASLGFPGF